MLDSLTDIKFLIPAKNTITNTSETKFFFGNDNSLFFINVPNLIRARVKVDQTC